MDLHVLVGVIVTVTLALSGIYIVIEQSQSVITNTIDAKDESSLEIIEKDINKVCETGETTSGSIQLSSGSEIIFSSNQVELTGSNQDKVIVNCEVAESTTLSIDKNEESIDYSIEPAGSENNLYRVSE